MPNPTGKGGFQERPETRNQNGQRNKAAVSFARSLRDYIVKEGKVALKYVDDAGKAHKLTKIEAVVRTVYKEAIGGNLAAVNFIADRVEGKVTDELKISGQLAVKGYANISPDDWDEAEAK